MKLAGQIKLMFINTRTYRTHLQLSLNLFSVTASEVTVNDCQNVVEMSVFSS